MSVAISVMLFAKFFIESCEEETFETLRRRPQPLHSTRRLFCANTNGTFTFSVHITTTTCILQQWLHVRFHKASL